MPALTSGGQLELQEAPQFIKYMGSKARLLEFLLDGLNRCHQGAFNGLPVCDLFAGSAILSGSLGQQVPVISNDIQHYAGTLAGAYLTSWNARTSPDATTLLKEATELVDAHREELPGGLELPDATTLTEFRRIEKRNQQLIGQQFSFDWHLFTRNYSGTWWSAEQCLWIDGLREVAERYRDDPVSDVILACLMHAMAYCGQGTGHYAQYRDAKTNSSMRDISIYRRRSIADYFERKYTAVLNSLPKVAPKFAHEILNLDYRECLAQLPPCTIYADPPYAFVHYSRFYHAIETLVLYDFPDLQQIRGKTVKGRYRENRHQSPFCIRSQVATAFRELFAGVKAAESQLVLSYSNSGLISLEEIQTIADEELGGYTLEVMLHDHRHMTMGRRKDRDREVKECLLIATRVEN